MFRNFRVMIATVCVLFASAVYASDDSANETRNDSVESSIVSPPQRPMAMTSDQLVALENLADDPQHGVAPDTRAAFSPEAADTMKSLSGPSFYAGYGGTLLYFLIAAAPL